MRSLTYNDAGEPLDEDFLTESILDAVKLEHSYDSLLRPEWAKTFVSTTLENRHDFGYEALTSRLSSVAKDTTYKAEYGYAAGSVGLIDSVTLKRDPGSGFVTMATQTRTHDDLDRLETLDWDSVLGASGGTCRAAQPSISYRHMGPLSPTALTHPVRVGGERRRSNVEIRA